jgi:methylamine utilization protein MauJ
MARFTVALRSPLAFRDPGAPLIPLKARATAAVIEFEGREFVWHPPKETDATELGVIRYGPMLAVLQPTDEDGPAVAASAQRLLSAIAFHFDQPVLDVTYGGIGGDDVLNPSGARDDRRYGTTFLSEAPAAIAVDADDTLGVALAYYREGLNSDSPFYECLAFRNVLNAVFDVREDVRAQQVTPEAAARDGYIDASATRLDWSGRQPPPTSWSSYLREDVRNALAHVNRQGRREINPDDAMERRRLRDDARLSQRLAKGAIEHRWPRGVRVTRTE